MSKLYDAFFKASKDAILIANADTAEIVDVNDAACQLFGYSREEFIGKIVPQLHPEEELEKVCRRFSEMISSSNTDETETLILCNTGEKIPVLITAANSFESGGNKLAAGFFKDLRPFYNLKKIAFEQSHIVRAPVAGLMGCLNLLETETDEKERQFLIESMKEVVDRLDFVIRNINNLT